MTVRSPSRSRPCSSVGTSNLVTLLVSELNGGNQSLGSDTIANLRRYYSHLCLARYASRIMPLSNEILRRKEQNKRTRVLDVGCGMGTETLLSAVWGAEACVGIDVNMKRIEIAKERMGWYLDRVRSPHDVSFLHADVNEIRGEFDVVFSMESVSHIGELRQFVAHVSDILSSDGTFIVTDTNKNNPVAFARAARVWRKMGGKVSAIKYGQGNVTIPYAHERLLSGPEIASLVREAGHSRISISMGGYLPCRFLDSRVGSHLERFIATLPIIRQFGGYWSLTAGEGD